MLLLRFQRVSGHPRGCGAHRCTPQSSWTWGGCTMPPNPFLHRHTSRYCASQTSHFPQIKNEALHQQNNYDSLYSDTHFTAVAGSHHGLSLRCVCVFLGRAGCKRSSVRGRESGRNSRLYHFPAISITCWSRGCCGSILQTRVIILGGPGLISWKALKGHLDLGETDRQTGRKSGEEKTQRDTDTENVPPSRDRHFGQGHGLPACSWPLLSFACPKDFLLLSQPAQSRKPTSSCLSV